MLKGLWRNRGLGGPQGILGYDGPPYAASAERLHMGKSLVVRKLVPGELLVGGGNVARFQAQLLQDDVSRHGYSNRLVERQVAVEALSAKAAVGREHQFVRRDVLQAAPDSLGHHI